jgi:iron complex transport system substrate-binding protein
MQHFPQRIISLQPSVTVILHALGLLDRIVACTKYCADVVPELANGSKLIVHDSWTAQAEQILAGKPDLVIASVPYQEKTVVEILKAGVPFLGLAPRSLSDIYSDIAKIAGIVGEVERGQQLIAQMKRDIEYVRRRVSMIPELRRMRVYSEEWGKPLIHSQEWVAELVEIAGGSFIGHPGKQTTAEAIQEEDPEVIIAAWCGAGDRVPLERIVRDRDWTETSAARAGRVYCITDELLNTPAPTLVRGLHALAHAIHPDEFPPVHGIRNIAERPVELVK